MNPATNQQDPLPIYTTTTRQLIEATAAMTLLVLVTYFFLSALAHNELYESKPIVSPTLSAAGLVSNQHSVEANSR